MKEFRIVKKWNGPQVAIGEVREGGACRVVSVYGVISEHASPKELLAAYPPTRGYYILSEPEGWEMSLDPFHGDAFRGTLAEGRFGDGGERRVVWLELDHYGQAVGLGPEVTP